MTLQVNLPNGHHALQHSSLTCMHLSKNKTRRDQVWNKMPLISIDFGMEVGVKCLAPAVRLLVVSRRSESAVSSRTMSFLPLCFFWHSFCQLSLCTLFSSSKFPRVSCERIHKKNTNNAKEKCLSLLIARG